MKYQSKLRRNLLLICLACILISILSGISVYDFVVFRPCHNDVERILRNSIQLHKVPSKVVLDLVMLSEGHSQMEYYVAQKLLARSELNKVPMIWWHMEYSLWVFLMSAHYSSSNILTLWLEMAPYEDGSGLNNSANYHYGRNLDHLNPEQLATLITVAKNPLFYQANPKELDSRASALLRKYRREIEHGP